MRLAKNTQTVGTICLHIAHYDVSLYHRTGNAGVIYQEIVGTAINSRDEPVCFCVVLHSYDEMSNNLP